MHTQESEKKDGILITKILCLCILWWLWNWQKLFQSNQSRDLLCNKQNSDSLNNTRFTWVPCHNSTFALSFFKTFWKNALVSESKKSPRFYFVRLVSKVAKNKLQFRWHVEFPSVTHSFLGNPRPKISIFLPLLVLILPFRRDGLTLSWCCKSRLRLAWGAWGCCESSSWCDWCTSECFLGAAQRPTDPQRNSSL